MQNQLETLLLSCWLRSEAQQGYVKKTCIPSSIGAAGMALITNGEPCRC